MAFGDYYYEYGVGVYSSGSDIDIGRRHVPENEIITLEDYRLRHGQYRSDPGLQGVTAKMPMIAIWDDHETSNDSWKGGAENHDDGEGSWDARKQAALRAYYEWMPQITLSQIYCVTRRAKCSDRFKKTLSLAH